MCGRNRVNACAYYILRTDNFHLINRAAARQLISRTRPRRNRIYIDRQLQCNLLRSSAGQSNPIIKLLNLGRIARRVPRGRDCFSGIGYTDKKKPVRSISPRPPPLFHPTPSGWTSCPSSVPDENIFIIVHRRDYIWKLDFDARNTLRSYSKLSLVKEHRCAITRMNERVL